MEENKELIDLETRLLLYLRCINGILELTRRPSFLRLFKKYLFSEWNRDPYCYLEKYCKLLYQEEEHPYFLSKEELEIFARKMRAIAESEIKNSSIGFFYRKILLYRLRNLPRTTELE